LTLHQFLVRGADSFAASRSERQSDSKSVVLKVSQPTLAEMVGTTCSRVASS